MTKSDIHFKADIRELIKIISEINQEFGYFDTVEQRRKGLYHKKYSAGRDFRGEKAKLELDKRLQEMRGK